LHSHIVHRHKEKEKQIGQDGSKDRPPAGRIGRKEMRNRGAVVIIKNGEAVMIKRIRNGEEYYVFPGGGIEPGETPEQAAYREALEELGIRVRINECLAEVHFKGYQYFFAADILEGEVGSGMAEEFNDSSRGTYEPIWVPLEKFSELDIHKRSACSPPVNRFMQHP
jgi:8-oxo-dGTP diphosphatase